MKILITGCKGYIGSVLVKYLSEKNFEVTGFDISYFDECLLSSEYTNYNFKKKDIRNLVLSDIEGFDVVIHLAALSNDPLGEFNLNLTEQINFVAAIKLSELSKKAGVKRFIYLSSQSMYGISNSANELDEDNSQKNPVTKYASTKWESEKYIKRLSSEKFTTICLRPSTVFGKSPRLRCDIVFNNLVACAYTTGKIEIKTDGTPWRPVIHVLDLCSAIFASIITSKEIVNGQSYNVGIDGGNYQVKQLAEVAAKVVPGCELIFTGEHSNDPRSYKVSFKKIFNHLGKDYEPKWDLMKGGLELVDYFKEIKFSEDDFRGKNCNRLAQLKSMIDNKIIDNNLYYI